MLERHTLGRAGRTRSVHDTAQIFWSGRNQVNWVLFSRLAQLLEAQDGKVGVGLQELVDVVLLDVVLAVPDDILDL